MKAIFQFDRLFTFQPIQKKTAIVHDILFIALLQFSCKFATSHDNMVVNTLSLLKEGDSNIILDQGYKDIILVIGNTGSGKTTFVQWIAGNNGQLISEDVGVGEFLINDNNTRIGTSTINSKTTFPELVVDSTTNEAYYDCPGFSDTRSVSHDIAGTYFIKRLTDHADRFKIILIVNYFSVQRGVDRKDFMILMRHTTDLIKNIEAFQNSIAIIATKVSNTRILDDVSGKMILVPDESVIKNIAEFLKEVKQDLKDNSKKSAKEDQLNKSAIKLLEIILSKENETYTRLGIFRRPERKGPISNMTVFQKEKKYIQQIVRERLKYSTKGKNDFGFTISEKSKNEVNDLVKLMHDIARTDVASIISEIQKYCNNVNDFLNANVDPFINIEESSTSALYINLLKMRNIKSSLPDLLKEVKNLYDIELLSDRINRSLTNLGILNPAYQNKINNIATQGRYHNFLKDVYERTMELELWESYFHPIKQCLTDGEKIEKHIRHKTETFNKQIKHQNIKNINEKELDEYYRNEIENDKFDIEKVPAAASEFRISTLNLLSYKKSLELSKILNNETSDVWPPIWIAQYMRTIKYLSESEKWYKFLGSLYKRLSTYDIQSKKSMYNVADINDWAEENKAQGIWIDKNNYKGFIAKIRNHFSEMTEAVVIDNIELTEVRLIELNHVLSLTLRDTTEVECLNKKGYLVAKGGYIKLSDITDNQGRIKYTCTSSVTSVDIFAWDTFIIDRDFNGTGSEIQLSIVAPKWHVAGTRKIDLDGYEPPIPLRAKDGYHSGDRGSDGMPGLPGGPGGNFFGKAYEMIGSENLMITANGGRGGSGQDGGNGAKGKNGNDALVGDSFEKTFVRDDKLITVFYNVVDELYVFHGTFGSSGGDGGNGGVGGNGGLPGIIDMSITKQSFNSPIIKSDRGPKGLSGKGGRGGKGGAKGNDLRASYCNKWVLFVPFQLEWCKTEVILSSYTSPSGKDGQDGFNHQDGLGKEPEEPKSFQNASVILNNYAQYLQDNMKDRFKKLSFLSFYHILIQ